MKTVTSVLLFWLFCNVNVLAVQMPGSVNILDYGALPDGKTLCTQSIQSAIDAAAAAGGGLVRIPAGRYLTGPIFLKSNVTLEVGEGATLLASQNFGDFPLISPHWSVKGDDQRLAALINGMDLENIAITGRGTIDGQGQPWWDAQKRDKKAPQGEKKALAHGRPHLIGLYRCRNVRLTGVSLMNSPSWTVNPVGCENVVVDGVSIHSPWDSPNTDGVNPESCRNVRIANCFIDTGDDCITLKSGQDEEGRAKGMPTENVTITNCVMYRGHGAVVIGSEMSGGVRNVTASNIVCVGTNTGVRIKSTRGRGGVVENIRFDNWVIENSPNPISITNYYTKTSPEPVSDRTPIFRDIALSHFTITKSPIIGKVLGLPEMPIKGLRITDLIASAEQGFYCDRTDGLELRNLRLSVKDGPALRLIDCRNVELDAVQAPEFAKDKPILRLENVQDAFIHGCRAWPGTSAFVQVVGEQSQGIVMMSNAVSGAGKSCILGSNVRDGAVAEK